MNLKKWKNAFCASWLDFLFPRVCLHCSTLIEDDYVHFCKNCFEGLEFSVPEERCRSCGRWRDEDHLSHCIFCQKNSSPFYQVLSTFNENASPSHTFQSKYRSSSHSFLTHGAGALMALHYAEKGLQWPELIVPQPSSRWEKFTKGFCPSNELAKIIGAIFQIPHVKWNKNICIADKKVLLVGESLHPSFFTAGEALAEGNPHSICGLTFLS